MVTKTFCPFINGNCIQECMFYSPGALKDYEGIGRNCIIAKKLVEFPDSERQEKALKSILDALKQHP